MASGEIVNKQDFAAEIAMNITDAQIEALEQRYKKFQELQNRVLVKDVDYGYPFDVKHVGPSQKPSLYKSGAEKLCILFNLQPRFEILKEIEARDFVMYKFKCELINRATEKIVGEGFGSANSEEKSNWKKQPLAAANAIMKIAEKRALVDAVLKTTGVSNIFTQDLEDYTDSTATVIETPEGTRITDKQIEFLKTKVAELAAIVGKTEQEVIDKVIQTDIESLTKAEASQAITKVIDLINKYKQNPPKQQSQPEQQQEQQTKKTKTKKSNNVINITNDMIGKLIDDYLKIFPDREDFFLLKDMPVVVKYDILIDAIKNKRTVEEILQEQQQANQW